MAVLVGLAVSLLFMFTTRYVSLASMMAGVGVAGTLAVRMAMSGEWDPVMLGFGVLLAVLVIVRHRSNIGRLIAGTEPKSGRKKS